MLGLVELGSLLALVLQAGQEATIQCCLDGGCSHTKLCGLLHCPLACIAPGPRIAPGPPSKKSVQLQMIQIKMGYFDLI